MTDTDLPIDAEFDVRKVHPSGYWCVGTDEGGYYYWEAIQVSRESTSSFPASPIARRRRRELRRSAHILDEPALNDALGLPSDYRIKIHSLRIDSGRVCSHFVLHDGGDAW